jgi:hypothetical protein
MMAQWAETCCKERRIYGMSILLLWKRNKIKKFHTQYGAKISYLFLWQEFTHMGKISGREMMIRVYGLKPIALLAVSCFTLVLALLSLQPWIRMRHIPPKYRSPFNGIHGVISQKTEPNWQLRTIGAETSYRLRPTRRREAENGTGTGYRPQTLLNFPVVLSERHFYWRLEKAQILRLDFS